MLVTLKHGNHITLTTIIIMLNYTSEWSITQVAVTLGVIWVTEIIVCMRIMFIVNNRPTQSTFTDYRHPPTCYFQKLLHYSLFIIIT